MSSYPNESFMRTGQRGGPVFGEVKMYTYKLEMQGPAIAAHCEMPSVSKGLLQYVIYDDDGKLIAMCPAEWSQQHVARVVDRMNAESHVVKDLKDIARAPNGAHDD